MPDIYSVPEEIKVRFLKTKKDNLAIFRSKAVGEPPLMYGIGAFFAVRNVIKEFNPSADVKFSAPITPEKVLTALYQKINKRRFDVVIQPVKNLLTLKK